MRFRSQCVLGGLGAAAVAGILVAALEASVAAMPERHGVDPTSVNRTLKGDRLPAGSGETRSSPVRTIPNAMPAHMKPEPRLPDGCVSASEWRRANIYTAEVAGRCVA
jgi:hypothetical protein